MPFHIRDRETDTLVRTLAQHRGVGLTEAVKQAVTETLEREKNVPSLRERLKPIIDEVMSRPSTGLEADKAFFDALSGEL